MSRKARRPTSGRHVEPIRQHALLGAARREVEARWEEVAERRRQVDAQLARLARERHELEQERSQLRERLWPRRLRWRGRRRPPVTDQQPALPSLPVRLTLTWGRALRDQVLRILRDVGGALSLVEIHRLLHLKGFAVDSDHPTKALADALGYETEQGRTERVRRGCYRIRAGT